MKLGLLTAILDGWSFEEVIEEVSKQGLSCVEVACWPVEKSERRYGGVHHIDVEHLDEARAKEIKEYCSKRNVEISALGYYPNTLDPLRREQNIAHLKKVIVAAELLDVGLVTTFIGRDQTKSVEENLKLVQSHWPAIIHFAEEHHVKIAIENCPMLFGQDQWPGGQNLMYSPAIWRQVFEMIPSDHFGLNFDPSHFVWQQMDYVKAVRDFKDKIFHVHFKDIKLKKDKLAEYGVLAYPLSYMDPKIPGLGDVNWGDFVSELTQIGYEGYACLEIEDYAFEGSKERILDSIRQAKRYMELFVS